MKQQIRFGTFETNSSSTHSLTIGSGTLVAQPFDKKILRAGVVPVHPGEYGWEFYRYYGVRGKLEYLVSQQLLNSENSMLMDRDEATRQLCENNHRLAMLAKVVQDHTGCRLQIGKGTVSLEEEAHGVGAELYESEEALKQFLFDETAFIQTGNDNSPVPFMIQSDKGLQFTYGNHLCEEAPKSYIQTTLRMLDKHPFLASFGTMDSGLVEPETDLFKRLCSKMVVIRGVLVVGKTDSRQETSARDDVAAKLLGKSSPYPGVRALSTFDAKVHIAKDKSFPSLHEEVYLDVLLPKALLKELNELPACKVVDGELKQAQHYLTHWKKKLDEVTAKGESAGSKAWASSQVKSYTDRVNALKAERQAIKRKIAERERKAAKQAA